MSTGDVVVRQYHQLTFVTEQMMTEVNWRRITTVNYNVNWRRGIINDIYKAQDRIATDAVAVEHVASVAIDSC